MDTTTSEQLAELAKALAAAQAEIAPAHKDSINPHFNRKYADLTSVWEACRGPLTKHGLSVVQTPVCDGARVGVTTLLLHVSGQFIRATLWMTPERPGPHALGSALTYARRYALAAFVGVAPVEDDDDGNAGARGDVPPARRPASKPRPAPPPPQQAAGVVEGAKAAPQQLDKIMELVDILGWNSPHRRAWLQKHAGTQDPRALSAAKAEEVIGLLERAAEKPDEQGAA